MFQIWHAIFGHVIAKCLYATGRRPFALPHRRNYVPAKLTCPRHVNTLLFNASLFSFSRGQLYSMAILHVAREFTVVTEPIRDKALHRIKCFMII